MSTPADPSDPKLAQRGLVFVRDGRRRVRWRNVAIQALALWPVLVLVNWGYDAIVGGGKGWTWRIVQSAFFGGALALGLAKMHWDRHGAMLQRPKRRS
jgi:hypothetical protein